LKETREGGFYEYGLQQAREPPMDMIRKLKSGKYRLYSRKRMSRTGTRRNLGTFNTRVAAERHERAVQYFKRKG
jgi:hypothetical protein